MGAVHIITSCGTGDAPSLNRDVLEKRIQIMFEGKFPKVPIHRVRVFKSWAKNADEELWRIPGAVVFDKAICAKDMIDLENEVRSLWGTFIEEPEHPGTVLTTQIQEYRPKSAAANTGE